MSFGKVKKGRHFVTTGLKGNQIFGSVSCLSHVVHPLHYVVARGMSLGKINGVHTMKKFLGLLTVLLISQSSFGRSLENIRLMYQDAPKVGIVGGTTKTLTVSATGSVVFRTSQAVLNGIHVRLVTQLSARQMDRIDRLIENARDGEIVRLPIHAMCFAPSRNTVNYTADNTQVFLRAGTVCDGISINSSRSAQRLVQMIDRLRMLAEQGVPMNEVDLD